MDLRSRDLSNPLLRSSLLSSPSMIHGKKKTSQSLGTTENKLLKKYQPTLLCEKKTNSTGQKSSIKKTSDSGKGSKPLLLGPSLTSLKRKPTQKFSPSSSVESLSGYTLQLSSNLLSQKTSSAKKRLISNDTKKFQRGLVADPHQQQHQLAVSGSYSSSYLGSNLQKQDVIEEMPFWERTISSDFAFPEYDFTMETEEEIESADIDSFGKLRFQEEEEKLEFESTLVFQRKKQDFINSVSASLIGQADFHDPTNANRKAISAAFEEVVQFDPEFLLKVALYTRKELNIRTTANFLLAAAAFTTQCRPFLKKYFQKSIAIPSDWIEVAEIYLTFHDDTMSFGALPAALRKVMTSKFPDFDKYQLGKYNKDKKKTEKKKKDREESKSKAEDEQIDEDKEEDEDEEEEGEEEEKEDVEKRSFNLKELIRKLHITNPVEHVMCLIGKRYPDDLESFYKSRLPGTWEPERAGKRMKLPTPETWETQVSLKGNKAETWESLIDHRKLPFMAMLRNLRNVIKAGVSSKHLSWIVKKLTDEGSVTHSKQFPFRFFSAYQVLEDMEEDLKRAQTQEENPDESGDAGRKRGGFRGGRGRGRGRGRGGGGKGDTFWKKKKKPLTLSDFKYDTRLLQRFRKALDTAVKIATSYNVKPIRGRTLILCSVTEGMWGPCSSARGLGKPKKVLEVGALMGLMCKYSCEECSFILCDSVKHEDIELEQGTILDNMQSVVELAKNMLSGESSYQTMTRYFLDVIRNREEIDTFIILSDGWMKQTPEADDLRRSISTYRHIINRNMLFVNIALKSSTLGISPNQSREDHENDIYIAGFSDQILRFIAERGDTGQINHVENIDKSYSLKDVQTEKTALSNSVDVKIRDGPPVQRWRTVRVFISSTFKDMHGERDLLTRYVFPELRSRARKLLLNIVEVDLRWGVTEEQTKHNKSVEVCLSEVAHCDYFICILGDRYGHIPESYPVIPGSEFEWLSSYPAGRSMTELEIQQAFLKEDKTERTFFFQRDSSFLDEVPRKWKKMFGADSDLSSYRLQDLKGRILNSGCETFVDYPCYWGGLVDDKPITSGLEEFGERVLNNLWNSLSKSSDNQISQSQAIEEEERQHTALMDSYNAAFVGRRPQLIKTMELIRKEKNAVFVITGQQGCGKSAFMAAVNQEASSEYASHENLIHFVGASPGSGQLYNLLQRICWTIKLTFNLIMGVPDDYQNFVTKLPKFLEQASERVGYSKFVIIVDGLDQLTPHNVAWNMEWLPQSIPDNVIFLLSCLESKECHKSLQRRTDISFFNLGPLDILDKSEMIRKTLGIYRKTLDESPFNNQMKLLASKRQANLAMYLSLACEEIRMFGVFEEVSTRLKSLSHTMDALLQDVIGRLEREHDKNMVQQTLVLLTCARDGLEEEELHHLLSLAYQVKGQKFTYDGIRNISLAPLQFIPTAVFARLIRSVKSLINPGVEHSSQLRIHSDIISKAVNHRYLKGTGVEMRIQMHILLAGYFSKLADPLGDGSLTGAQLRGITELPYHLTHAGLFQLLQTVLCNLHFIHACARLGVAPLLPESFQVSGRTTNPSRIYQKELEKFTSSPTVQGYNNFVQRCLHLIGQCPSLVWQEAANQPSASLVCQNALEELNDVSDSEHRLVQWKNKAETDHPCIQTLSSFAQPVSCLDISPDNQFFVCGSEDSAIRLYELSTGMEKRSFYGHADAITAVCFVGSNRLVSSSKDGRLSLWDVHQGHRISEMSGHRRHVNWCCSDKGGNMVASASWDCTVKLWDGRTGKPVCTLTEKRPINCVAFHSGGRKIVTASWDATLKVWDTVEKKKLAVLRGHKSAVRSVAWSPNDVYLASASMDGEVMMWSASNGVAVGCLSGHTQPINQLRFTPSGLELVTISDDHSLKVWSGTLGKQVCSQSLPDNSPSTVCVFSPDGDLLLTGYHSGNLCLLDVLTGQVIMEVRHHESRVSGVAWCSSNQELPGVIVGYHSGVVEILSSEDGRLITTLTSDHTPVSSVTFASRNQLVAASFEDASIKIWRLMTLSKGMKSLPILCTLYAESSAPVSCIAFSHDGTQLACVTRDKMLIVWASDDGSLRQEGKQPTLKLHGCHKDWITSVAWSDNGDYLVTGSNDCSLKLWSLKKKQVKVTFEGHLSAVTSVSYSHGCIVSSSADGQLKIWSHRGVEITTLHAHDRGVNCCDILVPVGEEDGDEDDDMIEKMEENQSWAAIMAKDEWKEGHMKKKMNKGSKVNLEEVTVASSSEDGTCQLWKPLQGNELCTLTGHGDRVVAVAVAGSGQVLSASLDKTVRIWKPVHHKRTDFAVHKDAVTSVVQSPSGNIVVTISRDGTASLWYQNLLDKSHAALIKVHTWQLFDCSANCGAFINERRVIFGSSSGVLSMWHIDNPHNSKAISVKKKQEKLLKSMSQGRDGPLRPVTAMSYNTEDDILYIATWDFVEAIEGLAKGKWVQSRRKLDQWTSCICYMPRRFAVVGLVDRKQTLSVQLNDRVLQKFETDVELPSVVCSLSMWKCDEQMIGKSVIIYGLEDGSIYIDDQRIQREQRTKQVHGDKVTAVNTVESYIITASEDAKIKLWKEREEGDGSDLMQVGQFNCQAPVTSLNTTPLHSDNSKLRLICGDHLGQVYVLEF